MKRDQAIASALEAAGLPGRVCGTASLSGGCIHEVRRATLDDGTVVVAKINDAAKVGLFEEESAGLDALARTETVLVPKPLGVSVADGVAVLLMEYVEPLSPEQSAGDAWAKFGEELAGLHAADAGPRYGFENDNHLGTTPQPNGWCDDWVAFNAERRLGHQVRLARDSRLLDASETAMMERVIARLDALIPRTPKPALLHGDLWSGNALPARDPKGRARIAVIDPAPYVGDAWADIAMMRLFGGFPRECFERYSSAVSDHDRAESRISVYQLYHVLNHVNIFGRGYAAQAMSIARSLL